jgi:zinc transport system substrate-binding protein
VLNVVTMLLLSGTLLRVVATTSTLAAICEVVAGEHARVITVNPGGACPGHFDLGAREALEIASSDLFLYQGWEPWLPKARQVIGPDNRRMVQVKGPKDLMVPPLHVLATKEVARTLSESDPQRAPAYADRALLYCERVEQGASRIRERCAEARVDTVRVVCSTWQEPFVRWMGYEIAATYGPPDEATAASVALLMRSAENVGIVVDNLQGGPAVGRTLATDLGARHVVLTNFVLQGNYFDALRSNAAAMLGDDSTRND